MILNIDIVLIFVFSDYYLTMSAKAAKQLIRREMKQKLRLLTNEEKESQSLQVTQKLLGKYF